MHGLALETVLNLTYARSYLGAIGRVLLMNKIMVLDDDNYTVA